MTTDEGGTKRGMLALIAGLSQTSLLGAGTDSTLAGGVQIPAPWLASPAISSSFHLIACNKEKLLVYSVQMKSD